jgi:phage shock protein C
LACVSNNGKAVIWKEWERRKREMDVKRLYRSRSDKMLAGVCGGLAEYFGIDPTIVRLLFVLLALVTVAFPVILAYFILCIVVPKNPGA